MKRKINNSKLSKGEIAIYKSPQGPKIQVKLEQDSVWLDAHLIAKLFDVNRPAIVKHINNIYKAGELNKKSTCSILEQVAADGKIRKMNFYNLDMIISVGYRVNSKRATQFRVWATKTLKDHLVKGYTINEKRLLQAKNQLKELQEAISFFQDKILPNCFCGSCIKNGKHTVKIVNYEIFINDLNDIELQGFCANCGGKVGRYLETGEVEKYVPRIKKIKEKYKNKIWQKQTPLEIARACPIPVCYGAGSVRFLMG